MIRRKVGKIAAGVTAGALALALGACSNGAAPESSATALDPDQNYNVTVWAWEPTIQQDSDVVTSFEKANPNIKVTVTNVGGSADEYTALSNAIQAGKGVPDVAQIEYYALPQYSVQDDLSDLSSLGASSLDGQYTTGTWSAVNQTNSSGQKGIFALPVDSGPVALFYNTATFEKAGIDAPPATWQDFYEDAKKIHALGDDYYITNDAGDAGFITSLLWQLDPTAFTVSGTDVTVDFSSDKVQEFLGIWQKLIDEKLIATSVSSWSDDWNRGLGDGTLASLVIGAWMPANLLSGAPGATGNFSVALAPTLDGSPANAENGGSSLAIPALGENKAAAYKFLEYVSAGDGATQRVQAGNFPSLQSTLKDASFLSSTGDYDAPDLLAYFGGQEYNSVLAQAAANVNPGWSYLPFQVAANTDFSTYVGPAYTGGTTLADGLDAWADAIVKYGNSQGYTVTKK
ncbi:extracellular solute-binding protein [Galbitalea sp. SE-J8]|uniref:extracellular solute-binding protein n=1 Tax=Galbitalea sp. SE-J8 TaxID=3054952 RepID=UPI00259C6A77|nr:extracellular solute-binding protein [Galbitalea sp. SE-J8]MDM4764247.1 extracellular solute-binding protein [Galbitalea sp. SE-J8]